VTVLAVMPTQHFEAHEVLQELMGQVQAKLQSRGLTVTTLLKTGIRRRRSTTWPSR